MDSPSSPPRRLYIYNVFLLALDPDGKPSMKLHTGAVWEANETDAAAWTRGFGSACFGANAPFTWSVVLVADAVRVEPPAAAAQPVEPATGPSN